MWIRLLPDRICKPLERKKREWFSSGEKLVILLSFPLKVRIQTQGKPVCQGVIFFFTVASDEHGFCSGRIRAEAGRRRGRGARRRPEERRGEGRSPPFNFAKGGSDKPEVVTVATALSFPLRRFKGLRVVLFSSAGPRRGVTGTCPPGHAAPSPPSRCRGRQRSRQRPVPRWRPGSVGGGRCPGEGRSPFPLGTSPGLRVRRRRRKGRRGRACR